MEKNNKSIGLTKETRRALTLQSIDLDIDFKLHCENILEEAAGVEIKVDSKEPAKKESLAKKPAEKKKVPEKEVEKNVAEPPVDDNVAEILSTDKKHFDTSGLFKVVEPSIYSNKKCFEFRYFTMNDGVVKHYFSTLKEAQVAKKNPEGIV